jgi:hypothetical protein
VQIFPEILAGIRSYCERKDVFQVQELVGRAADSTLTYGEIPSKEKQDFPWNI